MSERKIITTHVYPPIPIRQFDWSAHFDGEEEGPVGWGSTEEHAINNLQIAALDDDEIFSPRDPTSRKLRAELTELRTVNAELKNLVEKAAGYLDCCAETRPDEIGYLAEDARAFAKEIRTALQRHRGEREDGN